MQAWKQLAFQINGLALAPGLDALRRRGILERLNLRVSMEELVSEFGGNTGPLHALLRSLAGLGWIRRFGRPGSPEMEFQLCAELNLSGFHQLPALLEWIQEPNETPPKSDNQFLLGFLVAPTLTEPVLSFDSSIKVVLQKLGWMNQEEQFTELGNLAISMRSVYQYPMSYLGTIARSEEFLFGEPQWCEAYVDRRRDVLFSGQVFQGQLANEFLSRLAVILDSARPPKVIVDSGCGDGAILAAIGSRFSQRGLLLVGMDLNTKALEVAQQRLSASPHTFQLLEGDIGEPTRLSENIGRLGFEQGDILHVNKSVIHNRRHRPCDEPNFSIESRSALITSSGEPLSGEQAQASLVEFFRAWKPHLGPHGMLSIEAHSVDEREVAKWAQVSTMPCLEFTHALSRQNLLECETHRKCAQIAGLRSKASLEFGRQSQGLDYMSLDHWVCEA